MSKIHITGWEGTAEELMELLQNGMTVTTMETEDDGFSVNFTEKKVGRPAKISKEEILKLRAAGKSYGEIASSLGCSRAYAIRICRQKLSQGSPEAGKKQYLAVLEEAFDELQPESVEPEEITPEPAPVQVTHNNLKQLRKAKGLTQKQLADKSGLKLKRIQEWERTGEPIGSEIFKHYLARELKCRPEALNSN